MRIAAIDVGSNSIHMVVAQLEADGRFEVLDRAKEMVRLARRTLASGALSADAMNAGIRTLSAFRTLAERQGVERFKAVATSAVREAKNGGDFIQRVKDEVGLRVKVIPGREEARLIYLGVRHAIDLRNDTTLIVDIGGGSVELMLTEDEKLVTAHSLKLGVTRLSEQFLLGDRISGKTMSALESHLAERLDPVLDQWGKGRIRRVIGTSGTMLNLVSIAGYQRGEPPNGQLNNVAVTADEIAKVRRMVTKADRDERARIKGLDGKRADLIVAGACLADYIIQRLGARELVACTWALREGLVLDFIAHHRKGIEETGRYTDPRRRNVARFARHLGEIGTHGSQVAGLALRLFDQLEDQLAVLPGARDWLEFAALLHDVGHHIGHRDHQHHSYYLITKGDLLGFQRDELEIIGLTARYHRKGAPKESDAGYGTLAKGERRTVRTLAAILRIADGLDRSHYGVVREVTVVRRGDRLILQLASEGDDAELEIWEARRRAGLLEEVLGCAIDFEVVPQRPRAVAARAASAAQ
ncbi:MAG: putative Exopolyphosphatase [Deltaproteobacteria bacterium]|nr:putative Exopolyphosphatase [Deltaproteobacteria bacterium]